MANSRCFVQFPHPGLEHQPDLTGHKAWNTYANAHARKFMQFEGRWTDERGQQHNGELRAWCEWEAQSDLLQELDRPDPSELPRYLWLPYYTDQPDGYERLHNTDPFIFGDQFLYSNCKQAKRPNLRNLERGSVIAFGSKKGHGWVLDTVLVIADSFDYLAADTHTALAGLVPDAFLDVTGGPLVENDATETLRLYRGATPDDPIDGMFSFFPTSFASGNVGFERPSIELPDSYFKPKLAQNYKKTDLPPDTLNELWQSIAEQVLDAGLLLGTHAAMPEHREPRRQRSEG